MLTTLIKTIEYDHWLRIRGIPILQMLWILVLAVVALLLLVVCWLLLSPFQLQIDTRIPVAYFQWISIGKAVLVYEKDAWRLKIQLLFFKKEWLLEKLLTAKKKTTPAAATVKKKNAKKISLPKIFALLKTFRVVNWQIAADTGNYPLNAWLCPLNFYPPFRSHLVINFNDENYVAATVRNSPWKLLYAWIR
jgi:hypothetical protein